jgi:hypothetical protein
MARTQWQELAWHRIHGPVLEGHHQELRDEIANLVNAIAHGALRSSSALADRLAEAELKLAFEAGSAAIDGSAGEIRNPRALEFYEQFVATISARFQENSRETRTALSELIGGTIRLMPKEGTRELDVWCALSFTTVRLAELSSVFVLLGPRQMWVTDWHSTRYEDAFVELRLVIL